LKLLFLIIYVEHLNEYDNINLFILSFIGTIKGIINFYKV